MRWIGYFLIKRDTDKSSSAREMAVIKNITTFFGVKNIAKFLVVSI